MRRGFTLIEMLMVVLIMTMVMATLLPAMAVIQKKADFYSTANVIRTVHNTQRGYAMQFGYTGIVFGYTIYASGLGIQPWFIAPPTPTVSPITVVGYVSGSYVLSGSINTPTGSTVRSMHPSDIGKSQFWQPSLPTLDCKAYIQFTDNLVPVINTAPTGVIPTGATAVFPNNYSVVFSPRSGFAVSRTLLADWNRMPPATPGPSFSAASPTMYAWGALAPSALQFRLRSTRAGYRDAYQIDITKTGVININAL